MKIELNETNSHPVKDDIPINEILEAYDKAYDITDDEMRALHVWKDAMAGKPSNPLKRLRLVEQTIPTMLHIISNMEHYANLTKNLLVSTWENQGKMANKRWTQADDEQLIEYVASGDFSMGAIASMFGRTPSAISARVTKLVGVGKISQEIAGRFIGTLNGEHVVGIIDGELTKQ